MKIKPLTTAILAALLLTAPVGSAHAFMGPLGKCAKNAVCRKAVIGKAERIAKKSWEYMTELASEGMDEIEGLLEKMQQEPAHPSIAELEKRIDRLEALLLEREGKRQTVSSNKMLVAKNAGQK